ncbi:MAG TPA: hypothetical protein VH165_23330 [Kofleriaceae bacterium]|nr:hypothetical protein [Kofleriaceae bacterium]
MIEIRSSGRADPRRGDASPIVENAATSTKRPDDHVGTANSVPDRRLAHIKPRRDVGISLVTRFVRPNNADSKLDQSRASFQASDQPRRTLGLVLGQYRSTKSQPVGAQSARGNLLLYCTLKQVFRTLRGVEIIYSTHNRIGHVVVDADAGLGELKLITIVDYSQFLETALLELQI